MKARLKPRPKAPKDQKDPKAIRPNADAAGGGGVTGGVMGEVSGIMGGAWGGVESAVAGAPRLAVASVAVGRPPAAATALSALSDMYGDQDDDDEDYN